MHLRCAETTPLFLGVLADNVENSSRSISTTGRPFSRAISMTCAAGQSKHSTVVWSDALFDLFSYERGS